MPGNHHRLNSPGIGFFARGFFPYKQVLPGFAAKNTPEDFEAFGLEPFEPTRNCLIGCLCRHRCIAKVLSIVSYV